MQINAEKYFDRLENVFSRNDDYVKLIPLYYESNFNAAETSKSYYTCRQTVLNHLEKFIVLSGLDIRTDFEARIVVYSYLLYKGLITDDIKLYSK